MKQKSKKSGNKNHKMSPAAAEPSSDSEVKADDDEYGVQNRVIPNNECAVYVSDCSKMIYLPLEN